MSRAAGAVTLSPIDSLRSLRAGGPTATVAGDPKIRRSEGRVLRCHAVVACSRTPLRGENRRTGESKGDHGHRRAGSKPTATAALARRPEAGVGTVRDPGGCKRLPNMCRLHPSGSRTVLPRSARCECLTRQRDDPSDLRIFGSRPAMARAPSPRVTRDQIPLDSSLLRFSRRSRKPSARLSATRPGRPRNTAPRRGAGARGFPAARCRATACAPRGECPPVPPAARRAGA
jgi:hypothetical protein